MNLMLCLARSALDISKSEVESLNWKLEQHEQQVAQSEALETENLQLKAELEGASGRLCQFSHSDTDNGVGTGATDVMSHLRMQNSDLQRKSKELADEVERLKRDLALVSSQKLGIQNASSQLKAELQACQNQLLAMGEERDSMSAMVTELQQHLDESSVSEIVQLRLAVARLETDVARLAADNEVLTTQLRAVSANVDEDLSGMPSRSPEPSDRLLDSSDSEYNGSPREKGVSQGTQSEKLIDLSEAMVAEMADIAYSGENQKLGITLSHVQYAGLIGAVQKAMKQVEEAKQNSILGGANSFSVLDSSLTRSLMISGT